MPWVVGSTWGPVQEYRHRVEHARVEHDFHHIDEWSSTFDIYVILMTLFSRRVHRNPY
jgi:lipopolysaccharide/colanic/teichoic acid biosynthesis glycosyltransferase